MVQRKAQVKRQKKNKQKQNQDLVGVNINTSTIMPPILTRHLKYSDSTYVRNAPGLNYLVYALRINDLFDPDPAILSGSVSGFKEIMQFYQYYRVTHVDVNVKIANNEAFALMYGGVFSQSNLVGAITSRDDAMDALESVFSSSVRVVAAKGGIDTGELHMKIPIQTILGLPRQYLSDFNYIGNGLASPTIPLWFNLIVCSPTGTALTNGYTNATILTLQSQFFGLLNIRN